MKKLAKQTLTLGALGALGTLGTLGTLGKILVSSESKIQKLLDMII